MIRRSISAALRRAAFATKPQACGGPSIICPAMRAYSSNVIHMFPKFTWTAVGAFGATACGLALAQPAFASANQERSFIMVKPDGVQRALVADVIKRFESKGYKLVGIKVIVPSRDLASDHYAEHDGKSFFPKLVNFLSSSAVVAMVWEGKGVISYGRAMIGATDPLKAVPGTIRGDYGVDGGRNLIHGSDSVESAQREITLWFSPQELAAYELSAKLWSYES